MKTGFDGRAEDLIFAIKDFRLSRTTDGLDSSYGDTIQLINAIKDFYNAKKAYIGNPFKGRDSIKFKDAMDQDRMVFLGDLDYAGFIQKKTQNGPDRFSSIYGGKNYNTHGSHLNGAVVTGWGTGIESEYDALLKVFVAIFLKMQIHLTHGVPRPSSIVLLLLPVLWLSFGRYMVQTVSWKMQG